MDRLFDVVLVRPPANSYDKCVSTNPAKNEIDVTLAKEQHRRYVSILKELGVQVIDLPPLEDFSDSVFMQDPALLGSRSSVICRFGETKRRGEEKALLRELSSRSIGIGEIKSVRAPGTLEGGDILVTNDGLFVGESRRTNANGIEQLARHLHELKVVQVKTDLLHLLCACAYLSNKTMIMVPELLSPEPFAGFEFVLIPKEETYAADALYLGERRTLIPSGFPKTVRKLKEAGYEPIEVDISEFYKGDGGVTCLCSPIYRLF
jgi:dimethylargininase